MQTEARKFNSSSGARSFIRYIAYQLSEEDPEAMMEFLNTLEIAEAALVSCLIEEKEAEMSCLPEESAESGEFERAVARLKMTLAKLKCREVFVAPAAHI